MACRVLVTCRRDLAVRAPLGQPGHETCLHPTPGQHRQPPTRTRSSTIAPASPTPGSRRRESRRRNRRPAPLRSPGSPTMASPSNESCPTTARPTVPAPTRPPANNSASNPRRPGSTDHKPMARSNASTRTPAAKPTLAQDRAQPVLTTARPHSGQALDLSSGAPRALHDATVRSERCLASAR